MRTLPRTPNAIWWVQYQLLGGAGRLIPFNLVYAALLATAAIGMRRLLASWPTTTFCDRAITLLTGLQILLIIPGCGGAIYRALLRDSTAKMEESHRLCPMSSAAIVIGYMVGPCLQMLAMYTAGVVIGVFIIQWGTIGTETWLLGNLYMLLISPMVWAICVLVGVGRKKPINPTSILFIMAIFSAILAWVPALGLLSGLYTGYLGAFLMAGQAMAARELYVIGVLVTGLMTVIWARAAMRKFRRPDLPAFGPYRALYLLVIWLGASIAGLLLAQESTTSGMAGLAGIDTPFRRKEFLSVCLTSAGIGGFLISLMSLWATAWHRCKVKDVAKRARLSFRMIPVLPWLCAVILAAAVAPWVSHLPPKVLLTALAAVVASLIAIEGLMLTMVARGMSPKRWLILFIACFWAAPPMIDMWLAELRAVNHAGPEYTALMGFSPIGSIIRIFFSSLRFDLLPGAGVQAAIALVLTVFGRWSLRHTKT